VPVTPSTHPAANSSGHVSSGIPNPIAFSHERFWHKLGEAWEADLLNFLHMSLPKLIVVAVITVVLIQLLRFVTRRLRRLADAHMTGPGKGAQVRTLVSVINTAGYGLIIFHAGVQSLEIFNINVTPLLASAGVAGIAIGFGAQTIVHDVINGMLIVVENQFNVGDVIKIAGLTGTVEMMSLRKTTLRDGGDGTLYMVPNSQITTVSNLTRDYSLIQVNIAVDYREDPDKVLAVLNEVASEVAKEPQFAKVLTDKPQILGVDAFKGSEVIYPVVFKTVVNGQWAVSREFRRLIKIRFAKERILLGDPLRVYNYPSPTAQEPVAQIAPQAPEAAGGDGATVSPTDTTPKS
jgi:small conductance mechanosensitive channel